MISNHTNQDYNKITFIKSQWKIKYFGKGEGRKTWSFINPLESLAELKSESRKANIFHPLVCE